MFYITALVEHMFKKVEVVTDDIKYVLQISRINALMEMETTVEHINFPVTSEEELVKLEENLKNEDFLKNTVRILI